MASQSLAQNKPLLNFSHAPAILPHSMGQVLSDPNCASFQSSALAREIYDVFTFINQTCIFNATLSNIRFLPSCFIFFFHSFLSSSSHPFFLNKSIYCLFSCSVLSNSAAPWTAAHQAPLSMGFPRQEYWSG